MFISTKTDQFYHNFEKAETYKFKSLVTQAVKFHLKPSMQVLDSSSLTAAKNKHPPNSP